MSKIKTSFSDYILRRTLDVESYGSGLAARVMMKELDRAERSLTAKLATYDKRSFTRSRYVRMKAEINGVLGNLNKVYPDVLDKGRKAVIANEYDMTMRRMRGLTGKQIKETSYKLPVAQTKAMLVQPIGGQFLQDWIDAHIGGLRSRIRRELTQSVILGETTPQAAARLREAFGMSRKGAEMIARTAMAQSANVAREKALEPFSDAIEGWRCVSALDMRTCYVCAEYDGLEAKDRGELPQYPLHPNCRCVVVPVTRLDGPDSTRSAVFSQDDKVVHHRDGTTSTKWKIEKAGQVSAKTTFKDFFDRQPAAWQERYLGPARYSLYKAGKIDLKDLAKNHSVLSLGELRKDFP